MQDRIYLSRISFTNKYLLIGLKRDRFAVRESSAFDMDCNHGLEIITRITWEYNASQETKSEMYDSQSNQKILNTGHLPISPNIYIHLNANSVSNILSLLNQRLKEEGLLC